MPEDAAPHAHAAASALQPPLLRGDYKYIIFCGGHIVFSESLRKINAHCGAAHSLGQQKCHMDRSAPEVPDFGAVRVKGRPLGLLALWLKDPLRSASKVEHHGRKYIYAAADFFEQRRSARAELWALRVQMPDVLNLFSIEAHVPNDLLAGTEPSLWEPTSVF